MLICFYIWLKKAYSSTFQLRIFSGTIIHVHCTMWIALSTLYVLVYMYTCMYMYMYTYRIGVCPLSEWLYSSVPHNVLYAVHVHVCTLVCTFFSPIAICCLQRLDDLTTPIDNLDLKGQTQFVHTMYMFTSSRLHACTCTCICTCTLYIPSAYREGNEKDCGTCIWV